MESIIRRFHFKISLRQASLLAVVLISFALSNFTTIFYQNWFQHPDETGTYILGRELFKNGTLELNSNLNNKYHTNVFTPGDLYYNGIKDVPRKSVGIYLIAALGFLLGSNGPFVIITITSSLSILFLYLFVRELVDRDTALLSCIFWALSSPLIFWSNSLYGNLPALTFYLAGLYYLTQIIIGQKNTSINYVLMGLFFSISSLIRYEYIIFVILLAPLFIKYYKMLNLYYISFSILILLGTIVSMYLINIHFYGSAVPMSYVADVQGLKNTINSDKQNHSIVNKIIMGMASRYKRFLSQGTNPNWKTIWGNFNASLIYNNVLLILLGVPGIIVFLFKKNNKLILLMPLVISLIWAYDTFGGFHWGEGMIGAGLVYIRYINITYLVLSIFCGYFITYLIKKRIFNERLLLPIIISFFIFQSFTSLFGSPVDLYSNISEKKAFYEVNEKVKQLPYNSIIVTGFYNKAIIDRPTLSYSNFTGDNEYKKKQTEKLIKKLMKDKYDVFLIEAKFHTPSFINLEDYIRTNTSIKLTTTSSTLLENYYQVNILRLSEN